MPVYPEKFAQLLSEGIHRVRIAEFKAIQIVQDELGHALGRDGGSAIEYWRKGHVPGQLAELEMLAREIVRRGHLERAWLEKFLQSAGHPKPQRLCDELFGAASTPKPTRKPPEPALEQLAPFVVGPPIVHPRQFFGREAELKRIFHVWQQYPLQNVAVIGPRRSGKTSLLHYVKNIITTNPAQLRKDQFARWLPQPERFRWVYVDFQDARMGQQERLLRHILTSLTLPLPTPCDLSNFLDVMIDHLQTPTVIMLDEIGAALAAPELDLQFWWSLRSLSTNLTAGNLAFLLAAHALPMQLAQEQGKPSPFFNIFGHVLKLGPLSEEAARSLIASSPKPFAPADVAWILEQSQGWPFLLQMLCDTRLTVLEEGLGGEGWQAEALTRLEPYRYLLT
ncbi:MAG: ATP-binding protein [Caldilineaceae bacterium]